MLIAAGDQAHAEVRPGRWAGAGTFMRQTTGDSPGDCAAMADEARRRTAHAPITEVDVYRDMGEAFGAMVALRWAALVPTLGLHLERRSSAPGLVISWPASIPFGPTTACRVSPSSGNLHEFQTLRLVIEPAVVVRRPLSVFLRPGLRAVWHRSTWRAGFGAGIGSTLAWIDGDRVAASISPELSLHIGRCCGPGYLLINLRADRYYPRREPDTALVNVGFAYW